MVLKTRARGQIINELQARRSIGGPGRRLPEDAISIYLRDRAVTRGIKLRGLVTLIIIAAIGVCSRVWPILQDIPLPKLASPVFL
jgi:hypothetical protein